MAVIHSPRAPSTVAGRIRCGYVVLAFVACVFTLDATAQGKVTAVLKASEVDFIYRTSSSFLPCHELQNRVAMILRAVGARDDISVQAWDCDRFLMSGDTSFDRSDPFDATYDRSDPFGRSNNDPFRGRRGDREQQSRVRIRLMSPVEVTPQVLADMDKDKSRRELISRVTGNPMVAMNDPIIFPAQRQSLTLSREVVELEPADCELLEQLSRSVFRELGIRVLRRSYTCDRRQRSLIPPRMTVEALLPIGWLQQQTPATEPPERAAEEQSTSNPAPAPSGDAAASSELPATSEHAP